MSSEHHILPIRMYLLVFFSLLAGTSVTVWVAFIDLGPINTVAAITIAVLKGLLVVLYFMHVRYGSRLTWIFAGAGFLWLVILLSLLMGDIASRDWIDFPTSDFLNLR